MYQVHDGDDFLRVLHELVVELPSGRVARQVLAVHRQVQLPRGPHRCQRARVEAAAAAKFSAKAAAVRGGAGTVVRARVLIKRRKREQKK